MKALIWEMRGRSVSTEIFILEEEDEKVCKIKKGKENHSLFTAIPPNSFLSSALWMVWTVWTVIKKDIQKILGYVYMTSQHDVVLKYQKAARLQERKSITCCVT